MILFIALSPDYGGINCYITPLYLNYFLNGLDRIFRSTIVIICEEKEALFLSLMRRSLAFKLIHKSKLLS